MPCFSTCRVSQYRGNRALRLKDVQGSLAWKNGSYALKIVPILKSLKGFICHKLNNVIEKLTLMSSKGPLLLRVEDSVLCQPVRSDSGSCTHLSMLQDL